MNRFSMSHQHISKNADSTFSDYENNNNVIAFSPEKTPEMVRFVSSRYTHLLDLPNNWDGQGAHRISGDVFRFVIDIIYEIYGGRDKPNPQLVPLAYGGIQVEWHTEKGDLEVEVPRKLCFSLYFEDAKSGDVVESSGTNNFSQIENLLDRL